MMEILLLILSPLVTHVHPSCSPDTLAVYKMVLETHWSEKMFPKQYPQWRPPAQWSKTIGYSHPGSMSLFSTGSAVSDGVRMFVEKGDSDMLEEETAGISFLDTVIAPPIQQGEGRTETLVFVDGNNTKVSCLTAIVPSPDWFIGLDSVDLCPAGQWLDTLKLEVSPMDAGTDNGLTFTSPNWATDPRAEVFTITNTFPAHPAGSFNYPHWKKLPTIAVYWLQKQRKYSLIETDPRNPIGKKTTDEETNEYDVNTSSNVNETEHDIVPVNTTTEKVKSNAKIESDTSPISGQTNSQMISDPRNPSEKKPSKEIYRYDVDITSNVIVTEIDFVPLTITPRILTKNNTKTENDTQTQSSKTNSQIISHILTLDPVAKKTVNTTIRQTEQQGQLQLVTLGGNKEDGKKYQEILSNEIPELKFYGFSKLEFATHKHDNNSTLEFIPVRMVTKTKRLMSSKKNKDKKTVHDIDNSLKTKILVANEGLQTRHAKRKKKKTKGFRSSSSLTGYHTSTGPENFLKKKYTLSEMSGTKGSGLSGNLASLGKRELYSQILQSYKTKWADKRVRKRRFRKRKQANKKSPRNCQVSEWSRWSPCSVSCGIGKSVRQRSVERHSWQGGLPCPGLREYKWCGSARDCNKGYFDW